MDPSQTNQGCQIYTLEIWRMDSKNDGMEKETPLR